MKYRRPSKLRRVAKWAGVWVSVALAAACLPWCGGYDGKLLSIATGRAQFFLSIRRTPYPDNSGWIGFRVAWSQLLFTNTAHDNLFTRHVAYGALFGRYHYIELEVVLWGPLAAMTLLTVVLWRRDRRPPEGHCQACGYDLTGNVSGVCSECGQET